jgi:hypothetical protein
MIENNEERLEELQELSREITLEELQELSREITNEFVLDFYKAHDFYKLAKDGIGISEYLNLAISCCASTLAILLISFRKTSRHVMNKESYEKFIKKLNDYTPYILDSFVKHFNDIYQNLIKHNETE